VLPDRRRTRFVTVPGERAHKSRLHCGQHRHRRALSGLGSYQVDVDAQIPVASFIAGSGYAPTSTQASDPQTASGQNWLNGSSTITVGVTGTEPTGRLWCSDDHLHDHGYTTDPVTLSNSPSSGTIAQNTPFVTSFNADPAHGWIDGQNSVACQSTTLPGSRARTGRTQVPAASSTSTSTTRPGRSARQPQSTPTPGQCGISSLIDNGGCAYSDGPSQTAWYSSTQTVQIMLTTPARPRRSRRSPAPA